MLFKLLIKSKKIQFIYLQVKKVNQMKKTIHENVNETIYSKTLQNGLPVFLLPRNKMSKTFAIFTTNYGSIDRSFIPLNGENKITVPDGDRKSTRLNSSHVAISYAVFCMKRKRELDASKS